MSSSEPAIDHLVYATPDMARGSGRIRDLLGVEPVGGGRHRRWSTHNALVGMGGDRYLEIIAPDPEAPDPPAPRPFGLDGLEEGRLAAWAVRASDLEERRTRARDAGVEMGAVLDGSREVPGGRLLRWRLTDPAAHRVGGVVPFFIDWGDSPHPAAGLSHDVSLADLRAEHPEPERVGRLLAAVGLRLRIEEGPRPALVATLEGSGGPVELR